jgi:hypothetical protein
VATHALQALSEAADDVENQRTIEDGLAKIAENVRHVRSAEMRPEIHDLTTRSMRHQSGKPGAGVSWRTWSCREYLPTTRRS